MTRTWSAWWRGAAVVGLFGLSPLVPTASADLPGLPRHLPRPPLLPWQHGPQAAPQPFRPAAPPPAPPVSQDVEGRRFQGPERWDERGSFREGRRWDGRAYGHRGYGRWEQGAPGYDQSRGPWTWDRQPVGGHRYIRRIEVRREDDLWRYRRPFAHWRGFRVYGLRYGLVAPLAAVPTVSFLSDGLLVGSYLDDYGSTVYIYLVDEDGVQKEYFVNEAGAIVGSQMAPSY